MLRLADDVKLVYEKLKIFIKKITSDCIVKSSNNVTSY